MVVVGPKEFPKDALKGIPLYKASSFEDLSRPAIYIYVRHPSFWEQAVLPLSATPADIDRVLRPSVASAPPAVMQPPAQPYPQFQPPFQQFPSFGGGFCPPGRGG